MRKEELYNALFYARASMSIVSILAASVIYNFYQHAKISEQSIALEIWKNCPMPPSGFWLIVEADWVGKQSSEQLRCSFARQPITAPIRTPRPF